MYAYLTMNETPKIIDEANRPLIKEKIQPKKVDINILKARAKAIQDKENFKNSIVIIIFLIVLGGAGIYFSI